jgi:hypothetical protein
MIASGLKPITPTAQEVQTWRDFLAPVYPRMRGGLVPADLYDLVMETLRQHREGATTPAAPSKPK